jgi:hypothetical protein
MNTYDIWGYANTYTAADERAAQQLRDWQLSTDRHASRPRQLRVLAAVARLASRFRRDVRRTARPAAVR